jgi:hypothetical protein
MHKICIMKYSILLFVAFLVNILFVSASTFSPKGKLVDIQSAFSQDSIQQGNNSVMFQQQSKKNISYKSVFGEVLEITLASIFLVYGLFYLIIATLLSVSSPTLNNNVFEQVMQALLKITSAISLGVSFLLFKDARRRRRKRLGK